MAEIKISEMDELIPYDHYTLEGGTDTADYIPLLDSSEVDPNLQNKKVSIQTLFEDYTRLYNSPIYAIGANSVSKVTLINNLHIINNNSSNYILLDPNNNNRNVEISLLTEGQTRLIKNVGSNLITLTNLQFAGGTISLEYELPPYETVQVFFDGTDHHVIYLDQTITYPDSKLTVNNSAPSVTSAEVGLLGLNNNIPQYVNSVGSWVTFSGASTKYGTLTVFLASGGPTAPIPVNSNIVLAQNFNINQTPSLYTIIPVSYDNVNNIYTFSEIGVYRLSGRVILFSASSNQGVLLNTLLTGNINSNGSRHYITSQAFTPIDASIEIILTVNSPGATAQIRFQGLNNSSIVYIQTDFSNTTYDCNHIVVTKVS